jgi:tetratricopeptide (TPR) repeat protein
MLTFAISVCAQQSIDDLVMRAMAYLQKGDNAHAIADLDEVIKLRPDYADAYMLRSNIKLIQDQKGALADLDKFVELRPTYGKGYYQRAMLRMGTGDAAGALSDLDASVANNYKEDHVYHLRGHLRMESGDLKGALADYQEAIKLKPDNVNYRLGRAWVYVRMDNNVSALIDLNHVIAWYEAGPQKSQPPPAKPPAPAPAANTEAAAVAKATALPAVDIATETKIPSPDDKDIVPSMAEAYSQRGFLYSERGNIDGAMADFSKSIKLFPSAGAYFGRALELEKKGDLPGALADVNQSVALMANCGGCRMERGVILTLQDKKVEAQSDFDVLMKAGYATQTRIDQSIEAARKRLPAKPSQD